MVGRVDARPVIRRSLSLTAGLVLLCTLMVGPAVPVTAQACANGHVALSFDDGPTRESTDDLARILGGAQVPATFFLLGENVEAFPGRARRLADQGHRIYNHSYDHPRLTNVSDKEIRWQVWRARKALNDAGLPNGKLVRPPHGAEDPRVRRVIRNLGYRTNLWTVNTEDWAEDRTAAEITQSVRDGLEPGADFLLHDHQRMETVEALPDIVRVVRDAGYCFGVLDDTGAVVPPDDA